MSMISEIETVRREPARARTVFATEDFSLLRTAVAHYMSHIQNPGLLRKYGNLYHRLARLDEPTGRP